MKPEIKEAKVQYEAAVEDLTKFCDTYTNVTPIIIDSEYPIRVQYIPDAQLSMFGNENIDESGEVNDMTITCGLTITVKSTLKFKMDSKLLKKLIKLAERVGFYYYHAFRAEQGERITPQRPFMKAMPGFDVEVASELCCPCCEHPVINQWAPGTNPAFCQGCGQALDWSPEPEPETETVDEFEAGLEKLRELCEGEEADE